MNLTITGASGFVGQNLIPFLEKNGCSVNSISLREKRELNYNSDAIIHLAGKAHDTQNTLSDEEYYTINRDLTITLFDAFLQSDIQDFIFFSSVKAAADTVEIPLDEDYSPQPQTPYGKSKLQAEQYLISQTLPTGKRLFIIRPCMIHGPGNKGNLNLLFQVVKKGIPWPLGIFENHRSFLSIDNLNFLILQILKNKNANSGIYNFADDEPVSTNELIQLISEVVRKPVRILKINQKMIIAMAKLGDVLHLPFQTERLKKLTENYMVSNNKIKKELDIQQLPVTNKDGLRNTIKSFLS